MHYVSLPNAEVLALLERADFLALPTLHDTFGYSAMEALAVATPVIASDTGALPEIVDDGLCGYLLPFDNEEEVGKWRWLARRHEPGYADAYVAATERLADAMVDRLSACWQDPDAYERLSAGALEQVRRRFEATLIRDRLEELYERARR